MHDGQMVFSQLVAHGSRHVLDRCIRRYGGHRLVRSFSCREWHGQNQGHDLYYSPQSKPGKVPGTLSGISSRPHTGRKATGAEYGRISVLLRQLGEPKRCHFRRRRRASSSTSWPLTVSTVPFRSSCMRRLTSSAHAASTASWSMSARSSRLLISSVAKRARSATGSRALRCEVHQR